MARLYTGPFVLVSEQARHQLRCVFEDPCIRIVVGLMTISQNRSATLPFNLTSMSSEMRLGRTLMAATTDAPQPRYRRPSLVSNVSAACAPKDSVRIVP